MHELGVTKAVLTTVLATLDEHGLSKVTGVTLTVGELRGFEQEWVQRYFTAAAQGTAAAEATITLVTVTSRFHCNGCRQDFHVDIRGEVRSRCPFCGGRDYELGAGKELMITGMEAV